MLRNYLSAGLRNLSRSKLYAAINITGLSVAFTASCLIALFVRDELSYERWIPGYERIHILSAGPPGRPTFGTVPSNVAGWMKLDFPQMQAITRLHRSDGALRRGDMEFNEGITWADANVFDTFPLAAVAGDLTTALQRPDSLVLTRKIARKYFGRDDPIGETLLLDREHPMQVTAVIEDLPSNTHLRIDVLAPGHANFSEVARQDAAPMQHFGQKPWFFSTYYRLAPDASIELVERALPEFLDRRAPMGGDPRKASAVYELATAAIADIHLRRGALGRGATDGSALQLLYAVAIVGALIIGIASINFINLMTARAARRAVEVGVRKAKGASRSDLVVQFLGESLIHVILAMAVAVLLLHLLLPAFNAFLDRTITIDYWRDPWLLPSIIGFTLVVGVLAGMYPAFVLSAFRPAAVLKAAVAGTGGSASVRNVLVVAQFAVLIGLIIISIVFYRQSEFAINASLRQDTDQIVVVGTPCRESLRQEFAALPGVRETACAFLLPQFGIGTGSGAVRPDGKHTGLKYTSIDAGFLEMYGHQPVAGRFFSRDRAADLTPTTWPSSRPEAVVLNETAVRELGFESARAAIGQTFSWVHLIDMQGRFTPPHAAEIIGVAPDFPIGSVREVVPPVGFYFDPAQFRQMQLKLSGHEIPETLARIDGIWKKAGDPRPIARFFLDQRIQDMYRAVTRQTQLSAAFAGVALFIACLGLFGLSAFTAERRTKEIGVRKAMGASSTDILKLLLLQFTKPVLWAALIAYPAGYYIANRWLQGFAYHIELQAWMFVLATAMAFAIALLTVSVHSYLVARAKPLAALRYE